ncbi:protein CDV3 homolog B-like isoform X2 [Dendronephthya gigantea]|uniref:protein CDV3 homolog B-like isoform X2 n=1 Tax=Dendronephthya gigantea TaxID=151771 RepID=UPI00106C9444|nr:protein CDV3 homolog B-like isoform X2 [Dendronephthya gigantea]XP_028408740.1 protein CDV3 homolog B-like isoform X2 [Dendronephthya gigantea]
MEREDKSLDDFFAKKDKGKKGKSKTKGKFTTTSSITKQVEKSQKPVNEQTKEQKPTASQLSNTQNEEEWEDFNEPKEKDYSGLKVQSLQIRDKVDEDNDDKPEDAEEYDEDCTERKDKSSNVWQVNLQPTVPASAPEVKQEPKKEVGKGAYIPPSMRRAMANQAEGRDQSWKYRSGARERDPRRPPEIASEIAFPTLQASTASSKNESSSSSNFEDVRHGGRAVSEQSLNRRTDIAVDNKFSALSK